RHAPHIDAWETRERGLRDLVDTAATVAAGGPRPHKALVHLPILLPVGQTSTRTEPAKSLYARIPDLTPRPRVTGAPDWAGVVGRLPRGAVAPGRRGPAAGALSPPSGTGRRRWNPPRGSPRPPCGSRATASSSPLPPAAAARAAGKPSPRGCGPRVSPIPGTP